MNVHGVFTSFPIQVAVLMALVAEGVHAGCAAECMLWRPYAEEWTKKAEVVIGSGRYTINGKVYTERDDLGVSCLEGCIESVPAGAEGGLLNGNRCFDVKRYW